MYFSLTSTLARVLTLPPAGASLAHVAARDTDKAILKLLIRKYSEYIRMSNNQVIIPSLLL